MQIRHWGIFPILLLSLSFMSAFPESPLHTAAPVAAGGWC